MGGPQIGSANRKSAHFFFADLDQKHRFFLLRICDLDKKFSDWHSSEIFVLAIAEWAQQIANAICEQPKKISCPTFVCKYFFPSFTIERMLSVLKSSYFLSIFVAFYYLCKETVLLSIQTRSNRTCLIYNFARSEVHSSLYCRLMSFWGNRIWIRLGPYKKFSR